MRITNGSIGTVTIDRAVMGIAADNSVRPLNATGYDHFSKEENCP